MTRYKSPAARRRPQPDKDTKDTFPTGVGTEAPDVLQTLTKFEYVPLDAVDLPERLPQPSPDLTASLEKHGQIMPVILSAMTEKAEKAGIFFERPSGRYSVLEGAGVLSALSALYEKTKDPRYTVCQAVVVSPGLSEKELAELKRDLEYSEKLSPEELSRLSASGQVDLFYDFREVYLQPEALLAEYNNFTYTEEEIEMLADSIYHFGMWELPLILPYLSDGGSIRYRIIAGHKRIRSVLYIKEKAARGAYPNSADVLRRLDTIKVRLLPLGSTDEQVEAVHEFSNLMRRQLTSEQGLEHIGMIRTLPPVPATQEEFDAFQKEYMMKDLIRDTEHFFRALGWNNWGSRKTARYLSVHYYGTQEIKEAWKDPGCPLNQKQLVWIATTFKSFPDGDRQREVLRKSLENRDYLTTLIEEKGRKRRSSDVLELSTVSARLVRQETVIHKILEADLRIPDDPEARRGIVERIRNMKKELTKLEKKYKI